VKKYISNLGLMLVLLLFQQCGRDKEIRDVGEYIKWINDPENGLVQSKYIEGVKLKARFLPAEYLAYKEMEGFQKKTEETRDSLISCYSKSKTFLLTIGVDDRKKKAEGDIMYKGVTEYDEYRTRSYTMNFDMEEYIKLKAGDQTFRPVLSTMENVYSLSSDRNIYLVFSDDQAGNLFLAKDLDLTFNDEIFSTGINHFIFNNRNLNKIPHFIF
jgi:hypothetical protein